MAGGLMQLVAYGAQDVYLTGNPEVTFFQAKYKRHTNFAMENIEQTVNGTPANSGRVSVTVARNGDLVGDMYIQLTSISSNTATSHATNDCNFVAERAINNVELSIGGQRIDKHYQKWWRLYSELYMDESKKASYAKMTTAPSGTVYLPLLFFFNRNPGLYLPLIALQYHEVRIDIDLASDMQTYVTTGLKVWANYIYLDTEERRRFAQKGHEYLIEQVQHTGNDSVDSAQTKQVRLSYNHPVKELVWCFSNTSARTSLWNFTSKNLSTDIVLESNALTISESNCFVPVGAIGTPLYSTGTAGSTFNFTEEAVGALDTFKLVLNGQDRFKEQEGKYFNQVQPFNHHTGNPMPGVYAYSFALKPEEHQPTGTCNFSRIDNAQVAVKMNATDATTMHMFATNYNVLRIQSGMGGLSFSS